MSVGLDGVVVAQTILSEVDGERGRLVVRGLPIEDLVGKCTFEEMTNLLWKDLEDGVDTTDVALVRERLGQGRQLAYEQVSPTFAMVGDKAPIDALRFGFAALHHSPRVSDGFLAAGAIPVVLASHARTHAGHPPLEPDPSLGHVADFMRMYRGSTAETSEIRALEGYLVTVAEHGMNASTFTARVVASTRAGALWAILAALGALVGPLHGGAPGPVLDMLEAIGSPDRAKTWIEAEVAANRRIMGFGHRIYRQRDPRADVLKRLVHEWRSTNRGQPSRLALAEVVEREALAALKRHKPDRPLDTNVEFFTALLLDSVGFGRDLFTPLFAMGRVLGWYAHVLEQEKSGRLIRPQSTYVGPQPAATAV